MTPKRRTDVLRALCAQVSDEDGLNPRHEKHAEPRAIGHRELRLCDQIRRAIEDALFAEVGDAVLRSLLVEQVSPHPGMTRLLVVVRAPGTSPAHSLDEMRTRLARATGFIRAAVARAITRKRTPALVFHVAAGDPSGALKPACQDDTGRPHGGEG